MTTTELKNLFEKIHITVNVYALLRNNDNNRYFLIEHPVETMWLINGDFWYNYANAKYEFDKYELLNYQ